MRQEGRNYKKENCAPLEEEAAQSETQLQNLEKREKLVRSSSLSFFLKSAACACTLGACMCMRVYFKNRVAADRASLWEKEGWSRAACRVSLLGRIVHNRRGEELGQRPRKRACVVQGPVVERHCGSCGRLQHRKHRRVLDDHQCCRRRQRQLKRRRWDARQRRVWRRRRHCTRSGRNRHGAGHVNWRRRVFEDAPQLSANHRKLFQPDRTHLRRHSVCHGVCERLFDVVDERGSGKVVRISVFGRWRKNSVRTGLQFCGAASG